jgi:hypothetical protein
MKLKLTNILKENSDNILYFYHGTSLKNAKNLIKTKTIDLDKFGSMGAKARKINGLLGKGLYLTNSIDIANQFVINNGFILKIGVINNILDVSNFEKSKTDISDWFFNYINKKRLSNNRNVVSKDWSDKYLQDIDNQYDEEYVSYINEYAKENNYGGIKYNNDITVIWDSKLIKTVVKI